MSPLNISFNYKIWTHPFPKGFQPAVASNLINLSLVSVAETGFAGATERETSCQTHLPGTNSDGVSNPPPPQLHPRLHKTNQTSSPVPT